VGGELAAGGEPVVDDEPLAGGRVPVAPEGWRSPVPPPVGACAVGPLGRGVPEKVLALPRLGRRLSATGRVVAVRLAWCRGAPAIADVGAADR
jgi:hypothetical protein